MPNDRNNPASTHGHAEVGSIESNIEKLKTLYPLPEPLDGDALLKEINTYIDENEPAIKEALVKLGLVDPVEFLRDTVCFNDAENKFRTRLYLAWKAASDDNYLPEGFSKEQRIQHLFYVVVDTAYNQNSCAIGRRNSLISGLDGFHTEILSVLDKQGFRDRYNFLVQEALKVYVNKSKPDGIIKYVQDWYTTSEEEKPFLPDKLVNDIDAGAVKQLKDDYPQSEKLIEEYIDGKYRQGTKYIISTELPNCLNRYVHFRTLGDSVDYSFDDSDIAMSSIADNIGYVDAYLEANRDDLVEALYCALFLPLVGQRAVEEEKAKACKELIAEQFFSTKPPYLSPFKRTIEQPTAAVRFAVLDLLSNKEIESYLQEHADYYRQAILEDPKWLERMKEKPFFKMLRQLSPYGWIMEAAEQDSLNDKIEMMKNVGFSNARKVLVELCLLYVILQRKKNNTQKTTLIKNTEHLIETLILNGADISKCYYGKKPIDEYLLTSPGGHDFIKKIIPEHRITAILAEPPATGYHNTPYIKEKHAEVGIKLRLIAVWRRAMIWSIYSAIAMALIFGVCATMVLGPAFGLFYGIVFAVIAIPLLFASVTSLYQMFFGSSGDLVRPIRWIISSEGHSLAPTPSTVNEQHRDFFAFELSSEYSDLRRSPIVNEFYQVGKWIADCVKPYNNTDEFFSDIDKPGSIISNIFSGLTDIVFRMSPVLGLSKLIRSTMDMLLLPLLPIKIIMRTTLGCVGSWVSSGPAMTKYRKYHDRVENIKANRSTETHCEAEQQRSPVTESSHLLVNRTLSKSGTKTDDRQAKPAKAKEKILLQVLKHNRCMQYKLGHSPFWESCTDDDLKTLQKKSDAVHLLFHDKQCTSEDFDKHVDSYFSCARIIAQGR